MGVSVSPSPRELELNVTLELKLESKDKETSRIFANFELHSQKPCILGVSSISH
jgi:hypothetical protein